MSKYIVNIRKGNKTIVCKCDEYEHAYEIVLVFFFHAEETDTNFKGEVYDTTSMRVIYIKSII